jgi:hypothetical protein
LPTRTNSAYKPPRNPHRHSHESNPIYSPT